ncbi:acyl-CoA dehydrogenase [Desulfosarcina ovata subsp. sediminis]|uniref:3-methylmercaptopropionyl-CoA dehydrogenase n=1 Tax=Desulfosarcina ovata subsp. sediminis TaxID=885957 RepID=A0A5K7ZI84_9BACT|nr:acyl-CoA dehydrogenase [Desulfosarcina ovata]BBO81074.1 acyl-CoA dehydrogenase [Desulfosarcina ovata subsp. sediminis]
MAQLIADRRDVDFVLYEQMETLELIKNERYAGFNKKTIDMVVTEARNLAVKEVLPTAVDGDRIGATFNAGQVKVPDSYHRVYELIREGEWTSLTETPETGGQGMPHLVSRVVGEYLEGANWSAVFYAMMGHGTGKMIELYGTDHLKNVFLKNLYTGKWAGTMLLTEPNAGSDLGALTTAAKKNTDGTYQISGNKIFITNGEHDLSENIIHPVLARIEDAPSGTKGISIFIVPKIWVNEDGSLGDANDVVCTGIEEKMGIHGSATCSLTLGGKGTCRGFLLGEENKGMKIMFHMMNESRLDVALQGLNACSSAYLYALNYARERLQGRDLGAGKDDPSQVPIIRHPDVRRMLMWMKVHTEGMRSLMYYVTEIFDRMECTTDAAEKQQCDAMVGLLTPVVKAYFSERGFDACIQAIQVYGGYGFIKDYPVEQLARDCKIASLYEGTSGIQAMDLLGRKLGMAQGRVFEKLVENIETCIKSAGEIDGLEILADETQTALAQFVETAAHIAKTAQSPSFKIAYAHAHPFLEVMGDMLMAWMLLWRARIAKAQLIKKSNHKNASFYHGQIKSAEYFIHSILPVTIGKMNSIKRDGSAVVEIEEEQFGG